MIKDSKTGKPKRNTSEARKVALGAFMRQDGPCKGLYDVEKETDIRSSNQMLQRLAQEKKSVMSAPVNEKENSPSPSNSSPKKRQRE